MLIQPLFSISSSYVFSSCIAATVYVFIVRSRTAFPSHYIDRTEVVEAYSEVLFHYLPEETEEKMAKPPSTQSVSGVRFEPCT
jgi:hypothetical protein